MARIEGKFQVVYQWVTYEFTPREAGGYLATVLAAPNCYGTGDTFEEALQSATAMLMVWLRSAVAADLSIAEELLPLADALVDERAAQEEEF